MSKRTAGERIAFSIAVGIPRELAAKIIDRAIRREKAKAWDEGYIAGANEIIYGQKPENTYRGRKK